MGNQSHIRTEYLFAIACQLLVNGRKVLTFNYSKKYGEIVYFWIMN